MNSKQRNKNRATAQDLKYRLPPKNTCPNCEEKTHEGHYVGPMFGMEGFWACPKLYDENDRRIV